MTNNITRNEIEKFFKKFEINIDTSICDNKELIHILNNLRQCKCSERPDAFFELESYTYGIEHFQVSQYELVNQNQDISRIANGSIERRDKMKEDRYFNFNPSLDNLINSINRSIFSHSKNFESYQNNIYNKFKNKNYRLIIFIEDVTESAYIINKNSNNAKPVNPLLLKQISEIILQYKDSIFAIIYSYGNEQSKNVTGCTLDELEKKLNNGDLFDSIFYTPFECGRNRIVTKDGKGDENNITIKLSDRL